MKTIIILAIFTFVYVANAQEQVKVYKVEKTNEEERSFKNNRIGATYSMLSGYGLTYLRQLDDKFSIKGQLFGFGKYNSDPEEYYNNYLVISVGTELQYNLVAYNTNRLYGLVGLNYIFKYDDYTSYVLNENEYNLGLGIGFETFFFSNITLAIDGGYFGRLNYSNTDYNDGEIDKSGSIIFGLGVGVSLYYNF